MGNEYFIIHHAGKELRAYQKPTSIGRALKIKPEDMIPEGSPKRIIARSEDLGDVVKRLFPMIEENGANAFMEIGFKENEFEKLIQFYRIPVN